jgi:opacity protein-like surface antigen
MKANLIYTLLVLFFFSPRIGHGQDSRIDLVYLKNGSVIRGKIIEKDDRDKIKILSEGGNIWAFSSTEIDSISVQMNTNDFDLALEYQNNTSLGTLVAGGQNQKNSMFSALMLQGIGYHARYFSGIGIGIEFLEYNTLPLFIEQRALLNRNVISNFIYLRGGFAFPVEQPDVTWQETRYQGGWLVGAGTGIMARINSHNTITIDIGYRFQDLKMNYLDGWPQQRITQTTRYNRLELRLGLLFR